MAELRFIDEVAERAGVPEHQAAALTEATLRTLADRISGGEAADLADRVPDPLRPFLIKAREAPAAFPFDEFIRRVAGAAGVSGDVAKRGVGAVLQVLHPMVGHREFEEFMAQLPGDFGQVVSTEPKDAAFPGH
jgi:uncharacterized protein (DUF2267 family)